MPLHGLSREACIDAVRLGPWVLQPTARALALEDLHEGHCGAFWTEVENKWKDWVVLGWEELGCQKT